jgi:hypothetical protein
MMTAGTKILRAPELTVKALGLKPDGAPALEPHTCTFCGEPIAVGALCGKLEVGATFMDDAYLTSREKPGWLCGFCLALKPKRFMDNTQQAFITSSAVFKFGRTENRKWLLENLPEPPFVIVSSDTNSQHMIWKTPVSRSRDVLYLRIGWRMFPIRMPIVRHLVMQMPSIQQRVESSARKRGKSTLYHPFLSAEPFVADMNFGRIKTNVLAVLNEEERAFLNEFGPGEVWAACVLLSPKKAVEPETINIQ